MSFVNTLAYRQSQDLDLSHTISEERLRRRGYRAVVADGGRRRGIISIRRGCGRSGVNCFVDVVVVIVVVTLARLVRAGFWRGCGRSDGAGVVVVVVALARLVRATFWRGCGRSDGAGVVVVVIALARLVRAAFWRGCGRSDGAGVVVVVVVALVRRFLFGRKYTHGAHAHFLQKTRPVRLIFLQ
jgi:hypothetical protein